MSWLDRIFGRHKRAPEVQAAMEKRDQDFDDLGEAMKEVDRLKNGIIADYEAAERGIQGRP